MDERTRHRAAPCPASTTSSALYAAGGLCLNLCASVTRLLKNLGSRWAMTLSVNYSSHRQLPQILSGMYMLIHWLGMTAPRKFLTLSSRSIFWNEDQLDSVPTQRQLLQTEDPQHVAEAA